MLVVDGIMEIYDPPDANVHFSELLCHLDQFQSADAFYAGIKIRKYDAELYAKQCILPKQESSDNLVLDCWEGESS